MRRRTFLKGGLMMGAGAASLGAIPGLRALSTASTADESDQYYIFCYFSGGWDILLSLDPRDPLVYTPGAIQTTGIYPGYEMLVGSDGDLLWDANGNMFGPYMGPLMPWLNKMAIVRGMSMETLTHDAGRRRFLTGRPPSGLMARGSSAATWLAGAVGANEPIPNISLAVETYNVDQPNYASGLKVNSVGDLVLALEAGQPQMGDNQQAQINALLDQFAACNGNQKSSFYEIANQSRKKGNQMVEANFASLFDLMNSDDPAMAQLRDDFGIVGSGNNALGSAEAQGAAAVIALTSGMSRVASVRVANALDTHYEDNWTEDQGPNQERGFKVVAAILNALENTEYKGTGDNWLSKTTVIGFSEFSRQALLNGNNGRDHSLTNACFLAGGNIKGGQIIGASSNVGMTPMPVNLTTGLSDPGGEVVRPEHIHAALLGELGLTDKETDLRVDPLTALFG